MSTKKIEGKRGTEAVLCLLRREGTAKEIARRFNMSETTLNRLRDRFLEAGQRELSTRKGSSQTNSRIKELEKEIAERDMVIGEITIANRLLKKNADGLY
jgi:transposase-like protein